MPRPRNSILLLCFLLLCFSIAEARRWTPSDVPNPKTYPSSCIDLAAAKQGVQNGDALLDWMWVCNPDKLLSPSTVDNINQELYSLSQVEQKECTRGIQVTNYLLHRATLHHIYHIITRVSFISSAQGSYLSIIGCSAGD